MRSLAAIERRLERLLERPAARIFRTRLQPVQIQRRIERAMEAGRRSSDHRQHVPDRFVVRISPTDLASLVMDDPTGGQELASRLASAVLAFARARRYLVAGRPVVELRADDRVGRGDVAVDAVFARNRQARPQAGPEADWTPGDGSRGDTSAGDAFRVRGAGPSVPRVPGQPGEDGDPWSAGVVVDDPFEATMVFRSPIAPRPVAILREVRSDGAIREIGLDGRLVTIGRTQDNTIVLDDPRVSRRHASLRLRGSLLVLSDLDSTNGVLVNGARVREIALGHGDRVEIGGTLFVVEALDVG